MPGTWNPPSKKKKLFLGEVCLKIFAEELQIKKNGCTAYVSFLDVFGRKNGLEDILRLTYMYGSLLTKRSYLWDCCKGNPKVSGMMVYYPYSILQ